MAAPPTRSCRANHPRPGASRTSTSSGCRSRTEGQAVCLPCGQCLCILQACLSIRLEQAMGLFDSIAGQVAGALGGGAPGQQGGLLEVVTGLINNPQTGGLQGL